MTALPNALTERGKKRAEAILDAAVDTFLENGYDATSLQLIITRSGGSRRMIYDLYGGKDGLFCAAIESVLDRVVASFDQLALVSNSIRADLTSSGIAFVTALVSDPALAVFRIVLAEIDRFPHLGERLFDRGPNAAYEKVAAYLTLQHEKRVISVEDPRTAASQLLEMLKGELHIKALLCVNHTITADEIDRQVSLGVEQFLNGVAVR
ncbi:TetR/AcrR family transcriptional regulator [Alteromonas oceanisediminis]|uniref:TetR/AcrR family transcriptional regulator n=1 Tax=Alteromonas oceanisediminis TaxID=2836180 RepID=UPI001BD964DB|nr:TetR/AcrR family transcriptional regulator [Alteromonas oceanisediminis]MBT0585142.1 TetR/AcrR family transcriptional regulator [Alteromonas oceanisediminis]